MIAARWAYGRAAVAVLLVGVLLRGVSLSAPVLPEALEAPEVETAEDDTVAVETFVLGNTLFTFTTELARALVGELRLDPPGLRFEAIDELALLLLLPTEPDPTRDELVRAAAEGWAMAADRRGEPEEPAYWVAHGIDEQRYARLICLLVGSDPDVFADLGRELGEDEAEIARCVEEYERVLVSWTALLEPHARGKQRRARGGTIRFVYEESGRFAELRELVKGSGVLETAAAEILSSLVLPRSLTVRFGACGEEDARWLAADRQILICWELVAAFERLARDEAVPEVTPAQK